MNRPAFIFDDVCISPDKQIGRHSHPHWELSYVIYGAGTRTIGDLTEPMSEGEIIFIPPNIPHIWKFDPNHTDGDGNIANITVLFATSTLDNLSVIIPEFAEVVRKLKSLTYAVNIKGEAYNEVRALLMGMRGMTATGRVPVMINLLRVLANAETGISAGCNNVLSRRELRLEKVKAFCHCNYGRQISLDEIVAYVGMNKSAFCTFMRRETGMSMSEFVNGIRLERAIDMLRHTDKGIAEIAYDSGFVCVAYFNRLFRRKYGCAPKSIRKGILPES